MAQSTDKHEKDIDELSGIDTTGHSWDGIKELNNPLPRWWVYCFYITIVWAIGYCIFYPAIPLINSATPGVLGFSTRANVEQAMVDAKAEQAGVIQKIAESELTAIRDDETLFQFAVAGGESAFKVHCSQCHGSGAAGGEGYPNLNDDTWIWGGTVEDIHWSIANGIRYDGNDETRWSEMPAFGRDGLLESDQIANVTDYIMQISGQEFDAAGAAAGEEVYLDNCAACHGDDGTGDIYSGAPNLVDAIWLYGGSRDLVYEQIVNPKHGVMPAWGHRLDPVTVKQLTIYVHALGGGE
ncbi:MAG: cytochrome-c oxidase, cbb3-type subunit III [Alphaproteobacteria bacterium]|nr:cytochrome-c oxidase, cbb3-type subunit III [Alphaproteobacteria bacterium]